MTNDEIIDKTIKFEGETFTCDPADPGGATKYGITIPALTDYWSATGRRAKPTAVDIRDLTLADAWSYYRWFMSSSGIGQIQNDTLRWFVYDAAVHTGRTQAIRLLQRSIGVADDGVFGPKTVAALPADDSGRAARLYAVQQMLFYGRLAAKNLTDADKDGIPDQLEFLPGYLNRLAAKMETVA